MIIRFPYSSFHAMCTRDYVRIVHVEACSVRITRRCVIPLFLLVLRRSDKQKRELRCCL